MSACHRFTLAIGILLVTMMSEPNASVAQSCEVLPIDTSIEYRLNYQFRSNAPRCEGMYQRAVSGEPGMELVSLTFGNVVYDTRSDRYLEIKLPAGSLNNTSIQAVGIPEHLYYRLDVKLGVGQTAFRLPLGDVIAPRNILPDAFGIYGMRRLPDGQTVFLPVYAQRAGAAPGSEVVAVIRPGADVSNVQWRRYSSGGLSTTWAPVSSASGLVPRARRLEIIVGKDIPPQTTLTVSYLLGGLGRADEFTLLDH
jgi:hypothetical protein